MTEVLRTNTPRLFKTAVRRAAEALRSGDVVALPTETVYGLAANAMNASAVSRIFEIKGRPSHNPVIVHVNGVKMASACVSAWPSIAGKLAKAFWPGPLTLVLPRAAQIPLAVTAGGETVGVRWPSHPFVSAVIEACGFPLAAPSANLSNRVSPTNANHVLAQLKDKIRLIIDGGESHVGIESTVLDVSLLPPRLLRPGIIGESALVGIVGKLDVGGQLHGPLRSPGMLKKHYSPKARLVVRAWRDDAELENQIRRLSVTPSECHIIAHTVLPGSEAQGKVVVAPREAMAFARVFYSLLHDCDAEGARLIVAEALPDTEEWRAVADRLARAAAD
jgi:L-threonylcarbamoyladenylate synthase